jgi:U3 small nucleolar RNA-associated protein 24
LSGFPHLSDLRRAPLFANPLKKMGRAKKTRKFALAKKMISPKDNRVKSNVVAAKEKDSKEKAAKGPRQVEQSVSALWFQYNAQLGPPYQVLVDTNFINFSIR